MKVIKAQKAHITKYVYKQGRMALKTKSVQCESDPIASFLVIPNSLSHLFLIMPLSDVKAIIEAENRSKCIKIPISIIDTSLLPFRVKVQSMNHMVVNTLE
jgi:hypothetical protein